MTTPLPTGAIILIAKMKIENTVGPNYRRGKRKPRILKGKGLTKWFGFG